MAQYNRIHGQQLSDAPFMKMGSRVDQESQWWMRVSVP